MFLLGFLTAVIAILAVSAWLNAREQSRLLEKLHALKPLERDFLNAHAEFQNLARADRYVSDRQYRLWKEKHQFLAGRYDPDFRKLKIDDPLKKIISDFQFVYAGGREFIDKLNNAFIQRESPKIKAMLDEKKIQYNDDQVNAIASDEDNTLLIAGAGTGKTTTILGKLAYLIKRAEVGAGEILLLSFTGRAVKELEERIAQKFPDLKMRVQTFHSFGLSILGKAWGRKPDLAFGENETAKEFLEKEFDRQLLNPAYLLRIVEYFAYYLKPVVLKPGFETLDNYYKYLKTEQNITLKKEKLRSQQEVMIANFLYMNGIEYKYEQPYSHETANRDYRQYKPDFYLPDHDVYIEHFGIDREGRTHFTNDARQNEAETQKYQEGMEWKRGLHEKYGTRMIETFSYEFAERTWKEELTERLRAQDIELTPRNVSEVFEEMRSSMSVREVTQLFLTFLDLCKSNGYDLEILEQKILTRNSVRELAFFDIFAPIYQAYEERLNRDGKIDFHDMLIKAAHEVANRQYLHPYRHVIIDEFQDFSVSKHRLVKALCDQNPDTKLFCVGDDWQSIFRFTGSDISLMTNFEEEYGLTRKNQLVLTNRFGNGIAKVSNKFILKNPNQIKKEVQSKSDGGSIEILRRQRKSDTDMLLREILDGLDKSAGEGKTKSVFLLGRYKRNKPDNISSYKREYKKLSVEFLTIHASKGAEADCVIILDVTSGKHGMPSEVADDPLLDIVLSKGDPYPHAEERRLMYVAMTRAREKVFIVTEDGNESVFVLELEGTKKKDNTTGLTCKMCGGKMVERNSRYGAFLGCSNFPDCQHKINLRSRGR